MEDKYSIVRQQSGIWKSLRDGEFDEEEIWDALKVRSDCSYGVAKHKGKESSHVSVTRPLQTASRVIPRGSSSSNNCASSSHKGKFLQQSAPVNVPDWSKIYRNNNSHNKKASKNVSRVDDVYDFYYDNDDDDNDDGDIVAGDSDENDEEGDEYEYDSKLPPHEFIARRLARSQISSFSVLEGAGRTLKGRDLSKVRNAVLIKTGFLESL